MLFIKFLVLILLYVFNIKAQSTTKKTIDTLVLDDFFPMFTTLRSTAAVAAAAITTLNNSSTTQRMTTRRTTVRVVTDFELSTRTRNSRSPENNGGAGPNSNVFSPATLIQSPASLQRSSNSTILSTLTRTTSSTVTSTNSATKNDTILSITTTSGNSNGAPCFFPFTYKGKKHNTCIDKEAVDANGAKTQVKFCATTDNFDRDTKWGLCLDYSACHFPFVYDGQLYSDCISNYLSPNFCSTTPNFDLDRRWAQCPVVCTGLPQMNDHVVRFKFDSNHVQPCQFVDYYSKYNGLKLRSYVVGRCQMSYICERGYRKLYDEIECKMDGSYDKNAYCISENFFH